MIAFDTQVPVEPLQRKVYAERRKQRVNIGHFFQVERDNLRAVSPRKFQRAFGLGARFIRAQQKDHRQTGLDDFEGTVLKLGGV